MCGVRDSNYGTQLLVPGRSPCPWHQATDCLNRDIPSILPSTASFSSARSCARLVFAPLRIVLLLPQGQVAVGRNWDRGTPSLYKGLRDLRETHRVSSIVLEASAVLRHGRDVHPTWVKSSIETLSNTRVWGSVVQGQSPKRTLTVTDDKWLTA